VELQFTAFGARMALLMARGDRSGVESLSREFVRASTGAAEPELVAELLGLARELVVAFDRVNPGLLQDMLRGVEEGIAGQLDGDR
jgi:hypothetical protein